MTPPEHEINLSDAEMRRLEAVAQRLGRPVAETAAMLAVDEMVSRIAPRGRTNAVVHQFRKRAEKEGLHA